MDILKNKIYQSYNYLNRYTDVPFYYNTIDDREISGIGTQMHKNTAFVLHTVTTTDNLDYLALKYYNNPTYWWIIAYFNDIQDPFTKLSDFYKTLKIPNIASVYFGDER